MADFRRDPIRLLYDAFRTYGDVVRIRFAPGELGPFSTYLLFRPQHVKHVLHDNYKNYRKGAAVELLKVVMGDGLFLSEGEFWRRQRRLAQPAFHRQCIDGFVTLMTESIAAMLERWQPIAASGAPFDMAAEMMPLTMSIVWKAMVGRDYIGESAELGAAATIVNEFVNDRFTRYLPLPLWLPTQKNRAFRHAIGVYEALIYRTIDERRHAAEPGNDLLGMFLGAKDAETGASMSDRQLRDELFTILGAGQETTAVLLSWCWWLVARYPEVQARLRHEVETVLDGRVPTASDVPTLRYTRMFLQEALRLYPPAWAIPRQAITADEIDGHPIRAGAVVSLSPYVTHRHPEYWHDPEVFDPERFTPEAVAARPRFAFFPFGGGPRICIGLEFALVEAQLTLAMVCQRYRFRPVPNRPVEPSVQVTLRPRGGVWMTLAAADRTRSARIAV